MYRFIFWARILAENMILRSTWSTIPPLLGMSQSQFIRNLYEGVDASGHEMARWFSERSRRSAADPDALASPLASAFTSSEFDDMLLDAIQPLLAPLPEDQAALAVDIFKHDLDARPFPGPHGGRHQDAEQVMVNGRAYWSIVRQYQCIAGSDDTGAAHAQPLMRSVHAVELRFPVGFESFCSSTNHEITAAYVAEERAVKVPVGPQQRDGRFVAESWVQ